MTNYVNALVYAQIKNNVTDPNIIKNYQHLPQLKYLNDYSDWINVSNIVNKDLMTKELEDTTIKRACCQTKKSVFNTKNPLNITVKIPQPCTQDDPNCTLPNPGPQTEYHYIEKPVSIPYEIYEKYKDIYYFDDTYNHPSPRCELFYSVYCDNIIQNYKNLSGDSDDDLNYDDFEDFKRECTCHLPQQPIVTKYKFNSPFPPSTRFPSFLIDLISAKKSIDLR